jgi:hypothetical protein
MEEGRGAAVHVSVVGQKQLYAITSSALPSNVKEKRREAERFHGLDFMTDSNLRRSDRKH